MRTLVRSAGLVPLAFLTFAAALSGCDAPPARESVAALPAPAARVPLGMLPETVRPLRYRLDLTIDPQSTHFTGRTEVDVELLEPANVIWLHGRDLEINAAVVRTEDGRERSAIYEQVNDIGVARVKVEGDPLSPGTVTLAFDHRARFNDSLEGLYRITEDNRHYAATQFQATSARLVFPGFDEPRFKVPFDIRMTVREGHQAVTSTPAAETQPAGAGFNRVTFEPTQPLPTYLLAFIVGPWDERVGAPIGTTGLRDQPIALRGFASAGKGDRLEYALRRTGDIVTEMEAYFGTAYPYRKLDIIAVPDFAAGAMENAGAITYREQLLLITEESSVVRKHAFASVHAHELAHQWFGNLVTPVWWDDIWLNEAFATWFAARIMHRLEPDEGHALRQLRESLAVMHEDAQVSARRIREPITEHSDIESAFDGITYDKGAGVLAMLERFVGEDNFERGIQTYMQTHRFGNADARDFVRAVAATRPDLPDGQVEQAFFSFLEQPGTPLVELDWSCDDTGKVVITVEQTRYLPLGSRGNPERHWLLPMCVAYDDGGNRAEHCELVRGERAELEVPASACPAYVIPNADAAGYYRFSLDAEDWRALLSAGEVNDFEQLAIAASLSGAFRAGDLRAGEYVELVRALVASGSAEVVSAPLGDLEWIHDRLLTPENQRRLRSTLAGYYQDFADRVPVERTPGDSAEVELQRDLAELYALLIEAPSWRRELEERAVAWVTAEERGEAEGSGLPGHLRETAFAVAVENRGQAFAERLLELFHASDDAVLREEILRAVSRSANETLQARLRELVLSDALRDNEVHHVLGPQIAEPDSREAAWQWLLEHFDAVAERVPYWFRGSLIEYGGEFCSSERVEEINRTLADKVSSLGGGPRSLAKTIERIELCEALVRYHEDTANSEIEAMR